ncbi:MAG: glycosyltransferase [Variovorax paradoxus]|nr:glycosyltransferase family 2 protein [Variovorax paradoxus]MBW8718801.1 glycosyltransferase [Variovorax paradoxus]
MTDDNPCASARAPIRIAAVIPCYNEALSIAQVVAQFRAALPEAEIHVFDNNSTDDTAAIARASGATVTHVAAPGKGNVMRRMFADVEADVYVTVDGDATYDVASAPRLVELSGYRVFSRRYAKSFPALSQGFEIETELTVHALELRMPHAEFDTAYSTRPEGSHSKLSTYRDGWRILKTICKLFISERPLQFFSILAAVLAAGAIALAIPLLLTYLHTGLVPRLPTAVLATGAMLAAMLSMVCGVVMHAIRLARREAKRLRYLAIPGVGQFRRKP